MIRSYCSATPGPGGSREVCISSQTCCLNTGILDGDLRLLLYRAELDGLRAIAVLSVVLFHAGVSSVNGGYVGVDIFFVLSGFLITSILIQEIRSRTFSFSSFYERRIRRLLPPLIPVMLVSGGVAFILLDGASFTDFAKSLYSTMVLSANWYFLSSVGYFDGPGESTPLLHMWSLSIEEQFYIFFPAILIFIIRRRNSALPMVCAVLLLASFFLSWHYVSSGRQEIAFYSSLTRFWELLVGSFLATIQTRIKPTKLTSDALEVAGLTCLLSAIFTYSPDTLFPGPTAILPTLGTALIIAAGGSGRVVSPVLKLPVVVWFGLISYSLYLWHWPLLVFVKYLNPLAGPYEIAAAVMVAIVLSALSYYWLETPIRRKRVLITRRGVFSFGLVSTVAVAMVLSISMVPVVDKLRLPINNWVRGKLYDNDRVSALAVIEKEKGYYLNNLNLNYHGGLESFDLVKFKGYTCSFDAGNTQDRVLECLIGQAKKNNILIIGDSVGRDTMWSLRQAYPEKNFIMMHQSACPPAEYFNKSKGLTCFPGLDGVMQKLAKNIAIDGVILSFRYRPKHWIHVKDSIPKIKKLTGNIVLMGVNPMFLVTVDKYIKSLPNNALIPSAIDKSDKAMIGWDFDGLAREAERVALKNKIIFADISDFFCNRSACKLWVDGSYERPLFWDNQHITRLGISVYSRYLASQPEVKKVIEGDDSSSF